MSISAMHDLICEILNADYPPPLIWKECVGGGGCSQTELSGIDLQPRSVLHKNETEANFPAMQSTVTSLNWYKWRQEDVLELV